MAAALLTLIGIVCAMPAVLDAQTGQSAHRVIQNLPYDTGPTSDPVAHTLDLYLPEGRSNTPLLFFVHGATEGGGGKSSEGLVNVVELFLSRGIAVASTNYRNAPAVHHPVPVQDVARAFAWVHRNASRYALDPDNLFVAGHSGGAHLVALLGTEARFLEAEGLSPKAIRGVIASSGVYDLLNHRGPGVARTTWAEQFGETPGALKDVSPAWKLEQASPDTPPFLITYADDDRFGFGEQAKSFYGLLLNRRLPAHLVEVPARTHLNALSLLGRSVVNDTSDDAVIEMQDLLGPAMVWFVNSVRNGSLARSFYAVWPEGGPRGVPELPPPVMKVIKDVPYYDGPDADPRLHALDLYLPEGETNVPILFQVHGGRWRVGDKGNPETVVNLMGRLGWGVVATNYRLSPAVQHPAHIQDVARAFAWVYKNADEYGIDRERIVITGQSAGGHLVALLALDTQYLEAEGVPPSAIRGAVPTSGIYDLPNWPEPGQVPTGIELGFGTDDLTLRDASPINHLNPDAPPFLITFTDHDLHLMPEQAHAFYSALVRERLPARLVRIPERFHCCPMDYLSGLGQPPINLVNDVLGVELVHFLSQVTKEDARP